MKLGRLVMIRPDPQGCNATLVPSLATSHSAQYVASSHCKVAGVHRPPGQRPSPINS